MAAVAAAAYAVYKLANVSDEVAGKARDLGDSFNTASSDIEAYKKRIEECSAVIDNSESSYEEVIQARKDLLSIQDEMIDKFGKESREYQKFKEYFYQIKNQKILYRIYKNMLDK